MSDPKEAFLAAPERETVQSRVEAEPEIELGQWWWIQGTPDEDEPGDDGKWLACVVKIGSNYAEVESPHGGSARILFANWYATATRELNPERVLRGKVTEQRAESERIMGRIKEVTQLIGMAPAQQDQSSTALASLSATSDIATYRTDLIKAKEDTLPALFKELEETHKELAVWMKASSLPLKAEVSAMKEAVSGIDDRIFSLTLYAGLTEEVERIRDGKPAAPTERLRVMQRMCFMDEECLIGYEHGGMDFDKVRDFDRWLAKPSNADRILPYARCMVAFQVRRKKKHRESDGTLKTTWININMEKADKRTFLYLRNGERLYRLSTDLDLDLMIFPNRNEFDLSEPVMVYAWGGSPRMEDDDRDGNRRVARLKTMPVKTWEAQKKLEQERIRASKAWRQANPQEQWEAAELKRRRAERLQERLAERAELKAKGSHGFKVRRHHRKITVSDWDWRNADPHHREVFDFGSWKPFDDTYAYYDECMNTIKARVEYYNRVRLIIQGLFDRSDVFHPHPPVKLWSPAGFEAAVELIYDGEMTLYAGAEPDLDGYLKTNRDQIDYASVLVDPDRVWAEIEEEKEKEREGARTRGHYSPGFRTHNPGPGKIATPARVSRGARTVTFSWYRERQKDGPWGSGKRAGQKVETKITISFDELFDLAAYKPGDYLAFFADPRTRENYLEWADLFLTAEEYHKGNKKVRVQKPLAEPPAQKKRSEVRYCWMKRTKEDWTMENGYCGSKKLNATSSLEDVNCPKCLAKAKANGFTVESQGE